MGGPSSSTVQGSGVSPGQQQLPLASQQWLQQQQAQWQQQQCQQQLWQQQQSAQSNPQMPTNNQISLGAFPGIPNRFIQQIQRGECINFHSLYSAIVHGSASRNGYSLAMDEQADSDLPTLSILKKSAVKDKIKNFAAWLRTWNVFMSVFIQYRPHLVPQLLSYQDTITQLASTYHTQYWLAYDAAFRQKMANNPFLRWDVEDITIFNSYLRAAPVLASASLPVSNSGPSGGAVARPASQSSSACWNCGRYGHFYRACHYAVRPSGPPRPRPPPPQIASQANPMPAAQPQQGGIATAPPPFCAPQRAGQGRGLCFAWNNGQQCPADCRRDHRCTYCHGLHPRKDCRRYNNNNGNNDDNNNNS